jgi:hypothetical protein
VAAVVQKSGQQVAALADADMRIGLRASGNPHGVLPVPAPTPDTTDCGVYGRLNPNV